MVEQEALEDELNEPGDHLWLRSLPGGFVMLSDCGFVHSAP